MKDPALNDLPLLALTPEESQVSDNKETFIVIEDPTLNDLDLNIISSDEAISTKRDSSHPRWQHHQWSLCFHSNISGKLWIGHPKCG
jgi:hypothetical protein